MRSPAPPALSFRDPIHGFIRADPLEAALIACRPLQRLRSIHQLGFTFLVFPGAEHSRFSHALGAMELAGRLFDALAAKAPPPLAEHLGPRDRRLVRAAALVHDIGHAPFSHSTEDLFAGGIDHEEMSRRLLHLPEIEEAFAGSDAELTIAEVEEVLTGATDARRRFLSQIISGELDADKMDYLLRDSLYCGVRYGTYDLERLLDTVVPLEDPESGAWGIGVDEGGVHALEALVMARYYMFTQVYFNVTGKALELHFNEWLREEHEAWPEDAERFLTEDDVTVSVRMRGSANPHARAVAAREHFPLAFETREHLSSDDKIRFESLLGPLRERFAPATLLVSNASKDPHRFGSSRVLVRRYDGALEPMEEASHFIRHLARIERFRIYTPPELAPEVATVMRDGWLGSAGQ